MPKRTKSESKKNFNLDDLTIGDRIVGNMHHGRTEETTIKAIIPENGGKKFQIDFGNDQTALTNLHGRWPYTESCICPCLGQFV